MSIPGYHHASRIESTIMKLQHIPIGARFEYEGKVFVKTGPITASSENGGQQMIPRHAILKPLDLPQATPATKGKLTEAFYETCSSLIDEARQPELAAARERFLASFR
jgi:hypothetical protein